MTEDILGGSGHTSFFRSLVLASTKEDIITRSPRGQLVLEMLDYIHHLDDGRISSIATVIVSKLSTCLLAGERHVLTSVAFGAVWSAFHKMRDSREIVDAWSAFVTSNIPATHCREQGLALQIFLDRIVKKLIANEAASKQQGLQGNAMFNSLTMFESNAIRYMAGFVAVKLIKKFGRCTTNDAVQHKHKLFVKALQGMKATAQPGEPDSVLEYSTLWMELIDRGGLYHINDSVFELFQSIDLLLRQHFIVPDVQMYVPGTDLQKKLLRKL